MANRTRGRGDGQHCWIATMSQRRAAWDDYRKRRMALVVLLAGFLPAGLCASFLSKALISSDKLMIPVALCWMAAYTIAGYLLAQFPCPRCGLPFFYSGRRRYAPWTRECLHCSWPKWQEFDPSRDPPVKEVDAEEDTLKCFNCGADLAADAGTCPACGWSYLDVTASNKPVEPGDGSSVR